MRKLWTWLFWTLAALYAIALALFIIGTFGLFGQVPDPLSGIFLLPLGVPWYMLGNGLSDPARPWIAVLAPLINLAIVRWLAVRGRQG